MNSICHSIILIMLVSLICIDEVSANEALKAVGWIDSYQGTSDNYSLRRDAESIPVAFFTRIFKNDRISVKHAGYAVTIRLADGERVVIDKLRSPYRVVGGKPHPTLLANTMESVGQWLSHFREKEIEAQIVPLMSKSIELPEIACTALDRETIQVKEGKKLLYLNCRGGKAPYEIRVAKKHGGEVVLAGKIYQADGRGWVRMRSVPVGLLAGEYRMEIRDSAGLVLKRNLLSVSATSVPHRHELGEAVKLPKDTQETLYAAWLAKQGDGEWTYEAYQHVAGLASVYLAARTLRDALEAGKQPVLDARPNLGKE